MLGLDNKRRDKKEIAIVTETVSSEFLSDTFFFGKKEILAELCSKLDRK